MTPDRPEPPDPGRPSTPPASAGPPIRPSDLPLFYLLLVLHAAVLVALPIAALGLDRLLAAGRLGGGDAGRLRLLLGVATLLTELGILYRLRRLWGRLRRRGG